MASHDLWIPGTPCWMDTKAANMINDCSELNDHCYKCGWNPAVNRKRIEKIRTMTKAELAELFMDCASGVAWREEQNATN